MGTGSQQDLCLHMLKLLNHANRRFFGENTYKLAMMLTKSLLLHLTLAPRGGPRSDELTDYLVRKN